MTKPVKSDANSAVQAPPPGTSDPARTTQLAATDTYLSANIASQSAAAPGALAPSPARASKQAIPPAAPASRTPPALPLAARQSDLSALWQWAPACRRNPGPFEAAMHELPEDKYAPILRAIRPLVLGQLEGSRLADIVYLLADLAAEDIVPVVATFSSMTPGCRDPSYIVTMLEAIAAMLPTDRVDLCRSSHGYQSLSTADYFGQMYAMTTQLQELRQGDLSHQQQLMLRAEAFSGRVCQTLDEAMSAAVKAASRHLVKDIAAAMKDVSTWSQAETFLNKQIDGRRSDIVGILGAAGLPPSHGSKTIEVLLNDFSRPFLGHVPNQEMWRLVIDAEMHPAGSDVFDRQEDGYLEAMGRALQATLDSLGRPLTLVMLDELHAYAVRDVGLNTAHSDAPDSRFIRQYGTRAFYPLSLNRNASPEGFLEEFKSPNGSMYSVMIMGQRWIHQCRSPEGSDLIDACEAALQHYNAQIAAATDDDAKLGAIATCLHELEKLHPFPDGNIRLLGILVLNKLLMENSLSPAILANPNVLDAHTENEIVDAIKSGQVTFARLFPPNFT